MGKKSTKQSDVVPDEAPVDAPLLDRRSARAAADKAEKGKEKTLLQYLGLTLGGALVVLVIAAAAILVIIPKASGATPMTVLTSSMEPGLPPGTLIVVKPIAINDIMIGDVVTYQISSGRPEVITHRVIGVNSDNNGERTFVLQGDNNGARDAEDIRAVQIQGKLWYSVPYVGFVASFMNGEARAVIVPVAAGLLLSFSAWMIVSGIISAVTGRRKKARQARRTLDRTPSI